MEEEEFLNAADEGKVTIPKFMIFSKPEAVETSISTYYYAKSNFRQLTWIIREY